jgi:hypothetical protein
MPACRTALVEVVHKAGQAADEAMGEEGAHEGEAAKGSPGHCRGARKHAEVVVGMSKAQRYVALRRQGMKSRQAAVQVGFSGGVPSPKARDLWKAVQILDLVPQAADQIEAQIARKRRELKRLIAMREVLALG